MDYVIRSQSLMNYVVTFIIMKKLKHKYSWQQEKGRYQSLIEDDNNRRKKLAKEIEKGFIYTNILILNHIFKFSWLDQFKIILHQNPINNIIITIITRRESFLWN